MFPNRSAWQQEGGYEGPVGSDRDDDAGKLMTRAEWEQLYYGTATVPGKIPLGTHSGTGIYQPVGYQGSSSLGDVGGGRFEVGEDGQPPRRSSLPPSQGGLSATYLQNMRDAPGPGGGLLDWQAYSRAARRGRGSGPRFDQAAIQENIRSGWRSLMLEEPANLNGLVAEYMGDSRRLGMSLNMGAWLIQRARRDARYQLLYGRKPAELSEEEYIGSLRGVTEQLGLSSRGSRQQIEAAAGSGQTAAGFARRAGETREARSSNLGLFSRKVAQAFAGLGSLGRGR